MPDGTKLKAGFSGADHVGLTVPNLEEAVAWFERVLGAEPGPGPSRSAPTTT